MPPDGGSVSFLEFLIQRGDQILVHTGEHLVLVGASAGLAALIGIPTGIWLARRPRAARSVIGVANIVQTIPSLAMFGFLIPLPFLGGIGARTAIIALVLYALLPVLTNTHAGVRGVSAATVEAATGMGMTPRQILWWVELPLAAPVILAGLRIATVISVGVATIAAAIGAGGLGTLIFRGVAMVDNRLVLAGAVPAALMAILADLVLTWIERALKPERHG
jgi:osmoprotectant transport system permease protein